MYDDYSTETLLNIWKDLHEDAVALIFVNPTEAGHLGDLCLKIGQELRNRRVPH